MSTEIELRFKEIYKSREKVTGTYTLKHDNRQSSAKVHGTAQTQSREVEVADITNHFDGTVGLGLVPLRRNNTCYWGAIDIDIYDLDIPALTKKYASLPLHFCKTKSGGIHVYVFFEGEKKADDVVKFLYELARLIGFDKTKNNQASAEGTDVEIFPKQTKSSGAGNWINLPYAGVNGPGGTKRPEIHDGRELSLTEFLDRVESTKIVDFGEVLDYFVLAGGPPCLQKIDVQGIGEGGRNSALYNYGVFFKEKFDDWQDRLRSFNKSHVDNPLPEREVAQIIGSLEKDKAFYQCKDYLSPFCDKQRCLTRDYGVGVKHNPDVLVSALYKIKHGTTGDEVMWELHLPKADNERVALNTEELRDFKKVQNVIMERTGILMTPVKEGWDSFLREKLDDIRENPEEFVKMGDATTGDTADVLDLMEMFVQRNGQENARALDGGGVWVNLEDGLNYFRKRDFFRFLVKHDFTTKNREKKIVHILETEGRKINVTKRDDHKRQIRLWGVPLFLWQTEPQKNDGETPENVVQYAEPTTEGFEKALQKHRKTDESSDDTETEF